MRHILLEHARSHHVAKRGSAGRKLSLYEAAGLSEERDLDLIALDEALTRLAALDPQQSRIWPVADKKLNLKNMLHFATKQAKWLVRCFGYGNTACAECAG